MGIPGINLNDVTSAMTQIQFQNIRNLGANSNQPLITNQNDFQIFDNVTWIKGAAHVQARRQRDVPLARDPERRHDRRQLRVQQQHDVQLRGHGRPAAPSTPAPASTSRASCSATRPPRPATCSTRAPTPRSGPSTPLYVQDDFRVNSKLTLNLGLRYDVYVPWVEVDDRQSNFDVTTGQFVVASDNATLGGVEVGRYLQTYSKGDVGPRVRLRLRRLRHRPHHRPRRRRSVLELHAGRHVLVQGAEPAVPAVDGAHGLAEHQLLARASRCSSRPACRPLRASTSPRSPARAPRARSSTATSATPTRSTGTSTSSSRSSRTTCSSSPTPARAAASTSSRATRTRPRRRSASTNSNVNRPFATLAPALRDVGQVQSIGDPRLPRVARQVPAALRERLLAPGRLHVRQGEGLQLGQRRHRDGGERLQHRRLQLRGRPTTTSRHTLSVAGMYELPLGAGQVVRRLAGERHRLLARRATPSPRGRRPAILSTTVGGTGQRPNVIGNWELDNPTIDKWFEPAAFQPPADTTGTYGRRRAERACAALRSSTSTCRSSSTPRSAASTSSCAARRSTS